MGDTRWWCFPCIDEVKRAENGCYVKRKFHMVNNITAYMNVNRLIQQTFSSAQMHWIMHETKMPPTMNHILWLRGIPVSDTYSRVDPTVISPKLGLPDEMCIIPVLLLQRRGGGAHCKLSILTRPIIPTIMFSQHQIVTGTLLPEYKTKWRVTFVLINKISRSAPHFLI